MQQAHFGVLSWGFVHRPNPTLSCARQLNLLQQQVDRAPFRHEVSLGAPLAARPPARHHHK